MKTEVTAAIEELKHQFSGASVITTEDGQGGAHVIVEPVQLSDKFTPRMTWLGFHIPASYPYADIYPVFIGDEVSRTNAQPWEPPITRGHSFQGRTALQISRRNAAAQIGLQKANAKVLKILHYLEHAS